MPSHRFKLPLLFATAALFLSACAAASGGVPPVPGSGSRSGPTGAPAPDFRVQAYQGADALGGTDVPFSQVAARGKPVVLNFWAGLCPPCRAEMPDFQKAHQKYQDKALIFGLDIGPFIGLGSTQDGKALLRQLNITYPTGTTPDGQVVQDYGILGMPTTVFITPKGEVFKTHTGILSEAQLVRLIDELLQASGKS